MNLAGLVKGDIIASHKCRRRQQVRKNQAESRRFFQHFRGENFSENAFLRLHREWLFSILLQRGIAILDCEAAALPGRFLPELGRSSERPFFLRGSFGS